MKPDVRASLFYPSHGENPSILPFLSLSFDLNTFRIGNKTKTSFVEETFTKDFPVRASGRPINFTIKKDLIFQI